MPIDVSPTTNGNVLLFDGDGGALTNAPMSTNTAPLYASVLKKDASVAEGTLRFTSHFSTCPDSKKWRKR